MPLLDAALAFALVMLAVATVVSTIIGVIRSIFRLQRSSVEATLRRFLRDQVVNSIRGEAAKLGKQTADSLASSLDAQHRKLTPELRRATSRRGEGFDGIFMMEAQYAPVDGAKFLEVLGGTDAWKQLGEKSKDVQNELVSKIGAAYEDLAEDASGVFQRRARAISIGVGIVFALAFNVNAIRLIDVFLNEPTARASVIEKQGPIVQLYADSQMKAAAAGDLDLKKVEEDVKELRNTLAKLETPGLPVGYEWYPYCRTDNDLECAREGNWKKFVPWLLGVLLTGLLVGLGAPFWYDVVSRLATTARQLKGGAAPAGQTPQPAPTPPAQGGGAPSAPPAPPAPPAKTAKRRRVPGLEGS